MSAEYELVYLLVEEDVNERPGPGIFLVAHGEDLSRVQLQEVFAVAHRTVARLGTRRLH